MFRIRIHVCALICLLDASHFAKDCPSDFTLNAMGHRHHCLNEDSVCRDCWNRNTRRKYSTFESSAGRTPDYQKHQSKAHNFTHIWHLPYFNLGAAGFQQTRIKQDENPHLRFSAVSRRTFSVKFRNERQLFERILRCTIFAQWLLRKISNYRRVLSETGNYFPRASRTRTISCSPTHRIPEQSAGRS